MPVYLDPMIDWNKRIGNAGPSWCHMISDTPEELHAMADKIGLRRSWYQDHPTMPHYDISTDRVRALAVMAGAIECDRREFIMHKRRIHPRKETSK